MIDENDPRSALGKRFNKNGVVFVAKSYDKDRGYLMVPEVNICPERYVSPGLIGLSYTEWSF